MADDDASMADDGHVSVVLKRAFDIDIGIDIDIDTADGSTSKKARLLKALAPEKRNVQETVDSQDGLVSGWQQVFVSASEQDDGMDDDTDGWQDDWRDVGAADTISIDSSFGVSLVEDANDDRDDSAVDSSPLSDGRNLSLPVHVRVLVNRLLDGRHRDFSEPSDDVLQGHIELARLTAWYDVEEFFDAHIVERSSSTTADILATTSYEKMNRDTVPFSSNIGSPWCFDDDDDRPLWKHKTPKPDRLFGYTRFSGLLDEEWTAASDTDKGGPLFYAFLVLSFVSREDHGIVTLAAATGTCLRAAAACVNMVAQLGSKTVGERGQDTGVVVDRTVFGIVLGPDTAHLHVVWLDDKTGCYSKALVQTFPLGEPEQYQRFCRAVRNIVDWGCNARLEAIRRVLNIVSDGQSG